jgi:hypothetical protein
VHQQVQVRSQRIPANGQVKNCANTIILVQDIGTYRYIAGQKKESPYMIFPSKIIV